jgi:hypothetical protein
MPSQIPSVMHFSVPECHSVVAPDSAAIPSGEASESTGLFWLQDDVETATQSHSDVVGEEWWTDIEEMENARTAPQKEPGTLRDIRYPDGGFPDFYTPLHYPVRHSGVAPEVLPPPRDVFQTLVTMAPLADRLQKWIYAPTCTEEEKAARLNLGEKILDSARDGSALLDLAPSGILSITDLPLAELAPHLRLLFIQGGNLDALPIELCHLNGLTLLDFSFNRLQALPSQFPLLENLENLWLRSNLLSSLPENLQTRLPRLTSLDLENNRFLARSLNIQGLLPFESVCFSGKSGSRIEGSELNGQNAHDAQNAQAPPSATRDAAATQAFIRKLEIAIPASAYLQPDGMRHGSFQRFVRARTVLQQSATPCGRILGLYVDSLRRGLEDNRIDSAELTKLRHALIDFGAAMAWKQESSVEARADLDFRVLDQIALSELGRCTSPNRVAGLADLTSPELRLCNLTLLALCKTLVVLSEWHAPQ